MIKKNNTEVHRHHELQPNELSEKTKKSMLTRIISAIVLVILIVPSIFLGDWIYFGLMTVALGLACFEILGCAGKRTVAIYIIYFIFIALIAYWPMFKGIVEQAAIHSKVDPYFTMIRLPIIPVMLGTFVLFWLTVIYKDFSVVDASFLVTMAIIIGMGFQCLFYLRYFPMYRLEIAETDAWNFSVNNTIVPSILIIFVIICAIMTDIGAYFVGVLFGKTKMNERISPNKTWEGFFGGIIISFLVSTAIGMALAFTDHPILDIFNRYHWWNILIISFLTPFFATLGDFVFSAIKRHWGIKDYGKIIPGHGGVLDRLDSIFFAAIVASIVVFVVTSINGTEIKWAEILV